MLLLALLACTPDVNGLYETQRSAALEVATERPTNWEPDVTLQIAGPDFQEAVGVALKAALTRTRAPLVVPIAFGLEATLRPVFSVEDATLKASNTCPSCLSFDATLVGKATWSLGTASGTVPLDVGAQGVFSLEVAEGHIIQAVPRAVTAVQVKVMDFGGLKVNPSKTIQEWLTDQLSARIPKITIVDLDTALLPLRDLRLRSQGGAVRIEALSDVPGARPIGAIDIPAEGVRLAISETALVGLARRAAFQKGELTLDVYADPLAMSVEGSEFTLDLRLWRLVGRGWWRDYRIRGALTVKGGSIELTPSNVEELAHSPGAGLVDPLAALFEGQILQAITRSVAQTLPASRSQDLGVVQLRAETRAVSGRNQTLVVDGKLLVRAPDAKGP
jgi:hypothetical protein